MIAIKKEKVAKSMKAGNELAKVFPNSSAGVGIGITLGIRSGGEYLLDSHDCAIHHKALKFFGRDSFSQLGKSLI